MARSQFYDSVQDSSGNFVTTSEVTVYLYGTTTKATVYENESGSTQKANPFTPTDGFIKFWAEPGSYDILIADTANPAVFTTRTMRFDSIPAVSGVLSQTINDGSIVNADVSTSASLAYSKLNLAGSITKDDLDSDTATKLGLSSTSTVRRGKSIIATEESTSSATYVSLTTPDVVENIVLPTDGLIFLCFTALWKSSSAAGAGHAAVFLDSNAIGVNQNGSTAPSEVPAQADTPLFANTYNQLVSYPAGLVSFDGSSAHTNVTTGQILGLNQSGMTAGFPYSLGGVMAIFAAAGTYDVGVRFIGGGGITTTVKERKLWVWTQAF